MSVNNQIAFEAAQILLDTKSVLVNTNQPFVYTSGRVGPVYVDCRRLISFPKERSRLMDMGAALIKKECGAVDYIAGGETAGIPYAAFIAERLNKPMVYIRKKPKGFGRNAQIEGFIESGQEAIVVEDIQNVGVSVKTFIDALRGADIVVNNVFVIFQYGLEASQRSMKEMGLTLHALCSWKEVTEVAGENKYFDESTIQSVKAFLDNPEEWSEKNAHKVTKAAL